MKSNIWKRRNKQKTPILSNEDSEKEWGVMWKKYISEHKGSPIANQMNEIIKLNRTLEREMNKLPNVFKRRIDNFDPYSFLSEFQNGFELMTTILKYYKTIIQKIMFNINDYDFLKHLTDYLLQRIDLQLEIYSKGLNLNSIPTIGSIQKENPYLFLLYGIILTISFQYMAFSESEKKELRNHVFTKNFFINHGLTESYIEDLVGYGIRIAL